jgi:hypothetical protein
MADDDVCWCGHTRVQHAPDYGECESPACPCVIFDDEGEGDGEAKDEEILE